MCRLSMAESSLSSRQPIRSQVLHSGLAECQPVQTTEASTRGRTDSMNPARFPAGSSSDAMVTNAQRRRSPGRPLTREEQQQELVRNFQRRYKIDPVPTMTQFKLSSMYDTVLDVFRLSCSQSCWISCICRCLQAEAKVTVCVTRGGMQKHEIGVNGAV